MEEKFEVTYIEDIYEDFLEANLSESGVIKIKEKMDFIGLAPYRRTEQIENWNDPNLRKTRFGDYRMFMNIDNGMFTITCLSLIHRNKAYSKQNKKKVFSILNKMRINK